MYSTTIVTGSAWKEVGHFFLVMDGDEGDSGEVPCWTFPTDSPSTRTELLYLPAQLGTINSIQLRLDYRAGLGVLVDRVSILDRCAGLVYLFNSGRWMMCPGQKSIRLQLSGIRRSMVPSPKLARVNLQAADRKTLLQNIAMLKAKCKSKDTHASVGPLVQAEEAVGCTVFIEVPEVSVDSRVRQRNLGWMVLRSVVRLDYLTQLYSAMVLQGVLRTVLLRMQRNPAKETLHSKRLTFQMVKGMMARVPVDKQAAVLAIETEKARASTVSGGTSVPWWGKVRNSVVKDPALAVFIDSIEPSSTDFVLPGQIGSAVQIGTAVQIGNPVQIASPSARDKGPAPVSPNPRRVIVRSSAPDGPTTPNSATAPMSPHPPLNPRPPGTPSAGGGGRGRLPPRRNAPPPKFVLSDDSEPPPGPASPATAPMRAAPIRVAPAGAASSPSRRPVSPGMRRSAPALPPPPPQEDDLDSLYSAVVQDSVAPPMQLGSVVS